MQCVQFVSTTYNQGSTAKNTIITVSDHPGIPTHVGVFAINNQLTTIVVVDRLRRKPAIVVGLFPPSQPSQVSGIADRETHDDDKYWWIFAKHTGRLSVITVWRSNQSIEKVVEASEK